VAYRVQIDMRDWERAEGRSGLEQCIALPLDGPRRLVVHVVLRPKQKPQVARAWIEHSYVTRREGRKWRPVERVTVDAIELEARARLS
jgi:hypothetical protein